MYKPGFRATAQRDPGPAPKQIIYPQRSHDCHVHTSLLSTLTVILLMEIVVSYADLAHMHWYDGRNQPIISDIQAAT